jgi:hypothetical protein
MQHLLQESALSATRERLQRTLAPAVESRVRYVQMNYRQLPEVGWEEARAIM